MMVVENLTPNSLNWRVWVEFGIDPRSAEMHVRVNQVVSREVYDQIRLLRSIVMGEVRRTTND